MSEVVWKEGLRSNGSGTTGGAATGSATAQNASIAMVRITGGLLPTTRILP